MSSIKSLYQKIETEFPKLDIAVNNVGTAKMKSLTEITEEEFDYSKNVRYY